MFDIIYRRRAVEATSCSALSRQSYPKHQSGLHCPHISSFGLGASSIMLNLAINISRPGANWIKHNWLGSREGETVKPTNTWHITNTQLSLCMQSVARCPSLTCCKWASNIGISYLIYPKVHNWRSEANISLYQFDILPVRYVTAIEAQPVIAKLRVGWSDYEKFMFSSMIPDVLWCYKFKS